MNHKEWILHEVEEAERRYWTFGVHFGYGIERLFADLPYEFKLNPSKEFMAKYAGAVERYLPITPIAPPPRLQPGTPEYVIETTEYGHVMKEMYDLGIELSIESILDYIDGIRRADWARRAARASLSTI